MLYLKKKDLPKAFEEFRSVLSYFIYFYIFLLLLLFKKIEKDRKHSNAFLEIATIMSIRTEYERAIKYFKFFFFIIKLIFFSLKILYLV